MQHEKIMIIDDDEDIRDVLRLTLEGEGFTVVEACDGKEGVEKIRAEHPDIVITDFTMPKMNGGDVCRTIKTDLLLRHLPVIILSGNSETPDKIEGLDAGADDYLVKPFEPSELIARVRMIMRRATQDLDANPLTRLPGNISIQRELEARLATQTATPFAVCYADLDQFKSYNDCYGFERGDDAIRETARILIEAIQTRGGAGDFLGHIGGDDFLVMTAPNHYEAICQYIITTFDRRIRALYSQKDQARGFIQSQDRRGVDCEFPLMTISIGVVLSAVQPFTHVAELAERGAELKHYAKTIKESNFVTERRTQPD